MKFQIGDMVKLSQKKVGPYDEFKIYHGIVIDIIKKTYTVYWINTDQTYEGYDTDELQKVS